VGVAVSSADCVDWRVDLVAATGRLMCFCGKCGEGMLRSYSCSLSPSTIVSAPPLNSRGAETLLPRSVSLEWGKAASYAAF
jgi:hypothetical protein